MHEFFPKAKASLERAQNILIAGHTEPDADSLSAVLAFKIALENWGKKTTAVSQTPIPANLRFLPQTEKIISQSDPKESDLILALDYGDFFRLDLKDLPQNLEEKIITFDHHPPADQRGLKIVQNDFSSTCEIIFFFLKFLEIPLTVDIATCLLTGIFDDTGGFHHSTTSAQTLAAAAELMEKGAPLSKIVKNLKRSDFANETKLWPKAIEKIQLDSHTGLVSLFFSQNDLEEIGDNFNKTNLLSLLTAAPEAKVVLFLKEKDGKSEGSLRSQKDRGVNVSQIAQLFGGGGHPLAAGFKTLEAPEIVIEKIKQALKNLNTYRR